MALASGLLIVFVFMLSVGGGLLLYALVRQEHDRRRPMDRQAAERVARRDTGDRAGRGDTASARDSSDDRDAGNHWGDDATDGDDGRWGDR